MKILIRGENISNTRVLVYIGQDIIYDDIINFKDCEFDIPPCAKENLSFHFFQLERNKGIAKIDSEKKALNENLIMEELQYPYVVETEMSDADDLFILSPKRIKDFGDMIVFAPDMNLNARYSRKETDAKIKKVVGDYSIKHMKMALIIYPICLAISCFCVYLPNIFDSYTFARVLGRLWFFFVIIPPIFFVSLFRESKKIEKFLHRNAFLSESLIELI